MATLDGLASHKTTGQVLRMAKARMIETVVAVDERTVDRTADTLRPFIDRLVRFPNTKPYCEEILDELQERARADWCFIVSDDELPSEALWRFAVFPAKLSLIYRPQMVAPLPGWRGHYLPNLTRQPRIFPRGSIRWPKGGIDILPVRALPEQDRPEVLWHFNLWAPRASREAKAAAHEAAWNANHQDHPWPFPGQRSYLWEDYPAEAAPLDEFTRYRSEET